MENGFEIQVTVEPFIGLDGLETELTDAVMAQLTESGEIPDDDELNQMTMQTMYDLMQDRLEAPEYGEAESMTIRVTADSDNVYSIPEEDTTALDNALFPM